MGIFKSKYEKEPDLLVNLYELLVMGMRLPK